MNALVYLFIGIAIGAVIQSRPAKKVERSHGAISVTYEASGIPEGVAHFFRSLAK